MTWLIEAVCPNGHAICGLPCESPEAQDEETEVASAAVLCQVLIRQVELRIVRGEIQGTCRACGAPKDAWSVRAQLCKPGVTVEQIENELAGSSTVFPVVKPKPEVIH